jgi:hypothetical protein
VRNNWPFYASPTPGTTNPLPSNLARLGHRRLFSTTVAHGRRGNNENPDNFTHHATVVHINTLFDLVVSTASEKEKPVGPGELLAPTGIFFSLIESRSAVARITSACAKRRPRGRSSPKPAVRASMVRERA